MHCPNCKYNLTGNESDKCPECGTPLRVIDPTPVKMQVILFYVGLGLIIVYCLAQTLWSWGDYQTFYMLMATGYNADPSELADNFRLIMFARYLSSMSLGGGLICITLALFGVFRKVLVRL